MAAYEGVGLRIREQMLKLGYKRTDGEPDVQRFSWDFRYDRTLIYAWLADKATPFKDLVRLARDLQITVEWLLTGEERPKAQRRQGRRTAGSLLLAFAVGAAGVFGWPTAGSATGLPDSRAGVLQLCDIVAYQTRLRRWLAHPLLLLPCPA